MTISLDIFRKKSILYILMEEIVTERIRICESWNTLYDVILHDHMWDNVN